MSTVDRAFLRAFEGEARESATSARNGVAAKPQASADLRQAWAEAAPIVASPSRAGAPAAPHFGRRVATSAAKGAERRPLSAYAPPQATVDARFRPALEVDAFAWPATVQELTTAHRPLWQTAVETLVRADADGCSLVGVAGLGAGVGATTTTLALARQLVAAGKTIAVVDADFATARLATQLGLAVELGWEDVLAGRTPLAEAMVHSLADKIALLPLVQGGVPAAEKLDAIHASITAGVLRYHYDIVLFDLGDATSATQAPIARRAARQCRLDATLFVTGAANLSRPAKQLAGSAPELAEICRGVVENRAA